MGGASIRCGAVRSTPWSASATRCGAGDPAMVRLRDDGDVREVQAAFGWVAEHRSELEVS